MATTQTALAETALTPGKGRRGRWRDPVRAPWYFLVPAGVIFAFALLVPSISGIVYSFTNWNGLDATYSFVGLDNFFRLIGDDNGRAAVLRSVGFAAATTLLQTVVGLLLALGVNSAIKGRDLARMILFAPVVVMPIVTAYLWKFLLGSTGPANAALEAVGLGNLQQPWLGDPFWAFWSIVLVVVWQFSGVTMAIFLAGLQSIPQEIHEAVVLDGAGPVKQFFYVTLPLLRSSVIINVLLTLIGGLKLFDQVWVMTQGGPGRATENLGTSIYRNVFNLGDFSYGITLAVALTVIVSVFGAIQYGLLNRKGHES